MSGLKMGFIGKIDVLKGFEEYKRGLLGKLSRRDKSGTFRENCPEGIEHQYSEWIEDQYSLKAPFFNLNIFFTRKNPSRKSIFPKSSIFDSNALFLPNNPFKTSIFPKSPIFDPNALFLLQNPFRTLTFPKSPILDPNGSNFIQKSLQDINPP